MPVQLAHASRLMVTSAAAMFFDAGKLRESTMRTSPPEIFFVGAIDSILKVYRMGDSTLFPPTAPCPAPGIQEGWQERYRVHRSATLR